ncbi:hypothetical protein BDN70DRAFT_350315 [Pholiota conissans]|uniref:Uncharacterized protein n=1 Tax=Pholiota conissans TaxID=109636 RepID=A0A9P5Z9K3_9AGAR|nr:hypothetical protein BDN70DRAFT_350315 [Pholiota conissans]
MAFVNTPQHDEINLVRLVRRISKSVAKPDDWTPTDVEPEEQIWLRARKALQNVKFARRLIKNVEVDDFEPSPPRINYLNNIKIQLDRAETFLKEVETSSKPVSHRPAPILPTLPVPEPEPSALNSNSSVDEHGTLSLSPPPYSESTEKGPSPRIATQGLLILPDDADEISPTLITSTLPSLLPSSSTETATSTGFSRGFGATSATHLSGTQTSTAIHEQLTAQLETMAQQLKRNAIHFSNSMEKDKAVVEDAQLKLEGNYDVMQKERVRLRDHRGKSRGTTCMVVGIVLLVLLVFMLMVSVIRFS